MFAEIILSQRFPKHMGIFDYEIPPTLQSIIKPGSIVRIPFRSFFREGVVIRIKTKTDFKQKIKLIAGLVSDTPALTKEQLLLADWISQYYCVSLGTIIKSMLPPLPPKRPRPTKPINIESGLQLKQEEIKKIKQTFDFNKTTSLCIPETRESYEQIYQTLTTERDGMQLILVPTKEKILQIATFIPKIRQPDIVMIHGELSNNELFDCRKRIHNNSQSIIIGTKSSIFLPLHSLQRIIIDEEDNQNHKQSDQNPRFDARRVAEYYQSVFQCKLLLISVAPQVTSFYTIPPAHHITVNTTKSTIFKPAVIDMRNERLNKNYSPFSERLLSAIESRLKSKERILLLINKRGSANALLCVDCGTTVRCPNCNQAYTYHEQSKDLYCHRCLKRAEMPPFCLRCHGVQLKKIGFGTQSIETFLQKKFKSANTVRLDPETQSFSTVPAADIIVGTYAIINYLPAFNPSLIGVIDADSYLYLPDYRSSERTWQLIASLQQYNTQLLIQTYNIDHVVFESLQQRDNTYYYKRELESRKELGYPPYGSLIKLIYKERDKPSVITEAKRLYRQLQQLPLDVSFVTPLTPFQHGSWHMYVILRFDTDVPEKVIVHALRDIPHTWIIDRDPMSLL